MEHGLCIIAIIQFTSCKLIVINLFYLWGIIILSTEKVMKETSELVEMLCGENTVY